jgi:hypothetical protein
MTGTSRDSPLYVSEIWVAIVFDRCQVAMVQISLIKTKSEIVMEGDTLLLLQAYNCRGGGENSAEEFEKEMGPPARTNDSASTNSSETTQVPHPS